MTFTLLNADAIEAMQAMTENSVDAIVTDPPYGLEFMGKEWDRLTMTGFARHGDNHAPKYPDGSINHTPYRNGSNATPTKGYSGASGPQDQAWHHAWATEALRILKPGGHLLAFGGTRTYHRLACAIEDAGFEIRDCLAWMYGSGFPKSLDVSKAIDKANGKPWEQVREFGAYMRASREAAGLTAAQVNRDMGMPQGCGWWEGKGLGEKWDLHPPSLETWRRLQRLYGIGDDWTWFIEWAEAQRETLGLRERAATGRLAQGNGGYAFGETFADTAPATPEAQRWNGWGTALKPAFEPIVLARKPLAERNVAANVQRWGTGALNVDGCRIGTERAVPASHSTTASSIGAIGATPNGRTDAELDPNLGRWPANVTLGHSPDCEQTGTRMIAGKAGGSGTPPLAQIGESNHRPFHDTAEARPTRQAADVEVPAWNCAPGCAVAMLDEQTGHLVGAHRFTLDTPTRNHVYGQGMGKRAAGETVEPYGDTGGASRFFYCPKADREERNRGLGDQRSTHPTVKPVELMRWLCRMVTPKGGTVLDPFTGSGSTGVAAMREGFEFIGIEREADYIEIARSRIYGDQPLFNVEAEPSAPEKGEHHAERSIRSST